MGSGIDGDGFATPYYAKVPRMSGVRSCLAGKTAKEAACIDRRAAPAQGWPDKFLSRSPVTASGNVPSTLTIVSKRGAASATQVFHALKLIQRLALHNSKQYIPSHLNPTCPNTLISSPSPPLLAAHSPSSSPPPVSNVPPPDNPPECPTRASTSHSRVPSPPPAHAPDVA